MCMETCHITDDRSSSDMLDEAGGSDSELDREDGVLTLREQMLLLLFRQLSFANQDRIIRCAEVLSKTQN